MYINEIQFSRFRNYHSLRYRPTQRINLIQGQNAQGKTNLLEGVYLCCLGKSHRAKRDVEMIGEDAESAYCRVSVVRKDGPRTVDVLLSRDSRKRIKVLGLPIQRLNQLMGHIHCVFFSPEDLSLIKGGPSGRRRYLDVTLSQLRPGYYTALSRYAVALSQRNALLRSSQRDKEGLLAAFDETLSRYGGTLIAHRLRFVEELRQTARLIHRGIAADEDLSVSCRTQLEEPEEKAAAVKLYALLERRRSEDVRRGMTSVGPHRDDLFMEINRKEARIYASQGQQRTAVLSLKLSAMERMRAETGELPVLMLDDVLSELDLYRQQALLSGISGQAFLTIATFPSLDVSAFPSVTIQNGQLV